MGRAERVTQNGSRRTRQAERDRQTGRTDMQDRTGRIGQAELDGPDRTGQAELDG
jgi:hypothetical protein